MSTSIPVHVTTHPFGSVFPSPTDVCVQVGFFDQFWYEFYPNDFLVTVMSPGSALERVAGTIKQLKSTDCQQPLLSLIKRFGRTGVLRLVDNTQHLPLATFPGFHVHAVSMELDPDELVVTVVYDWSANEWIDHGAPPFDETLAVPEPSPAQTASAKDRA